MGFQELTVSFFGHRKLDDHFSAELELEKMIKELILNNEYIEFLVGRNGEFDMTTASVIRRCKHTIRSDNSALVLVLPYMTAEYRDNKEAFLKYYDEVEICDISSKTHFKSAHQARNKLMVDRSDVAVFYVDHNSGGAFKTMQYANRVGTCCINLANKNGTI